MRRRMIGATKRKTRMIGKMNNPATFEQLFEQQQQNQLAILRKGLYSGFGLQAGATLPVDDVVLCFYHVQQLVSEIGEILDADKRWKNFRNAKYDKAGKVEEIADCFIVLMNVAMFSGVSGQEMAAAIGKKLGVISQRVESEKGE